MTRPLPAPYTILNAHNTHTHVLCMPWRVLPSLAALPARRPAPPPNRLVVLCSNSCKQQPQAFTPGDLPTQGDAIVGGGLGDEPDAPVSVMVKDRSRDVDYLAVRFRDLHLDT